MVVVLLCLLAGAGFVAYSGWLLGNGADVPAAAYVSMAAGVFFSLLVGFGLMGLLFYSSRKGYDEPPVFVTESSASEPAETSTDSD